MKIMFGDDSFLHIDESYNDGKVVTITMCGASADGNSVTMSTSELDYAQAEEVLRFLSDSLNKV